MSANLLWGVSGTQTLSVAHGKKRKHVKQMCAILTSLSTWVKWHMIFLYYSYILSYNYKICQNKKLSRIPLWKKVMPFSSSPLAVSMLLCFSYTPISHTAPRASWRKGRSVISMTLEPMQDLCRIIHCWWRNAAQYLFSV